MTEADEITALRQALAESQQRLQSVVDLAGGPLCTMEFELGADGELVFVRADATARQHITVADPSFYGRRLLEVIAGMAGTPFPALLTEVARHGRAMPTSAFVPPGTRLGRPVQMFAFQSAPGRAVLKLWESYGTEESAEVRRRNQTLLTQFFQDSPVAIAVTRAAEGTLVDVNAQWSRLTGWQRHEVLGRNPAELDLWAGAAPEHDWDEVHRAGQAGPLEWPLRTRAGEEHVVSLHAARIEIGGAAHHLVYLVDVTERKRAEFELQQLNATLDARVQERTREFEATLATLRQTQDELVRNEKMAALGALVAGLAHELNTPIGNAVMVASTLAGRQREFEAAMAGGLRRSALQAYLDGTREAAEVLERNLQRAAELIGSFKQIAVDQSSYQRRRFELAEVVQEIAVALRPTLRRSGVTLVDETPPGLRMDSYPGPLGQVLINLVNNAVVHAFEGRPAGTVRIGAEALAGDRLRVWVADDGRGIAAEHLRQVFDPFFTTRLGQGGSGLGLHIAYTLVTGLLGGRIAVQSAPGQGTRVHFELPCTAPAATDTPAAR